MSERDKDQPYKPLGLHLKLLREKQQESLADASGAVEIEVDHLIEIEKGIARPSEDILLLLISHFAAKEDVAGKLWKQAGYANDDVLLDTFATEENVNISIGLEEMRINYTDAVHIVTNNYGVVINFLQSSPQYNKPQIATRVGMSKDYAKHMLVLLTKALEQEQIFPKSLPTPKSQKPNN